jgi:hypothetical protein
VQYGLYEVNGEWLYTTLGKMSTLFIIFASVALFLLFFNLFAKYRRLRRYSQLFSKLIQESFEVGCREEDLFAPERGNIDKEFMIVAGALQRGLLNKTVMAKYNEVEQAVELLARPFKRKVNCVRILGWSTCLVGWIGGLSEIRLGFRTMGSLRNVDFAPISLLIEDGILLASIGMAAGLACVWISSFWQNRLDSIFLVPLNQVLDRFK